HGLYVCARERRNMPQINPPTQPVRLFRLAEAVAQDMGKQHEGLRNEEAMLRAAIAWAKYARTVHLNVVERAKVSAKARIFVEPARRRRIRAAQHLRLRLTAVIACKFGLMKDERLLKIADLALSLIP